MFAGRLSQVPDEMGMASLDRLDILHVGTLPPQPGGAAVVGGQLLRRLATRGHTVRALAPISAATYAARADFAANLSPVCVTWFPVPRFEHAPDAPPNGDFARAEREQLGTPDRVEEQIVALGWIVEGEMDEVAPLLAGTGSLLSIQNGRHARSGVHEPRARAFPSP